MLGLVEEGAGFYEVQKVWVAHFFGRSGAIGANATGGCMRTPLRHGLARGIVSRPA